MNETRKRVLIYRIGSLGDTIIALPVFHKVREVYPDAHITLLTNKPIITKAAAIESVLGSEYFFDSVLDYPIGTRNPVVLYSLWKEIRSLNIDVFINLATTRVLKDLRTTRLAVFRDRLFFKSTGIKKIIGFPSIRTDYEVTVDPDNGQLEWEAKRLARRLIPLGDIKLTADYYWDLRFSQNELETARQVMTSLDVNLPVIAISMGTKRQPNDWEQANWLVLIKKLKLTLKNWQLLIVGAPDEFERAENCLAEWGSAGINLCGKTSPRVSGAVLKSAKIFIGHDSGPMHLAAAVGTPCVAIYSARNFLRQWTPRGDFNKIIYHQTDCAGCGLELCIAEKKKCILSITADEVEKAVADTLREINVKFN